MASATTFSPRGVEHAFGDMSSGSELSEELQDNLRLTYELCFSEDGSDRFTMLLNRLHEKERKT